MYGLSEECFFLWSWSKLKVVKLPSQSAKSHLNGFWPLWILRCVSRFPFSLNAFSQPSSGQTNGLSPVCSLMWILRRPALEYFLLHPWISHTNGFSPVWVSSWACKWPLVMNFWLHSIQTNGLSPVWVLMCVFRFPVSVNSLRHFSKGQISIFFSSLGLLIFSNCSITNFQLTWIDDTYNTKKTH